MKIHMLKITNFEINWFTEMLKQTRKMRYNVICNVESLLILSMENTLKWERLADKNEVKQKGYFYKFSLSSFQLDEL